MTQVFGFLVLALVVALATVWDVRQLRREPWLPAVTRRALRTWGLMVAQRRELLQAFMWSRARRLEERRDRRVLVGEALADRVGVLLGQRD